MRKFTSMLLIVMMSLLLPLNAFAHSDAAIHAVSLEQYEWVSRAGETYEIDGESFIISEHTEDIIRIDYQSITEDGLLLSLILDKNELELYIEARPAARALSTADGNRKTYLITDMDVSEDNEVVIEKLSDVSEDAEGLQMYAAGMVIPGWLPLIESAVRALITAGLAAIIGSIVYISVQEASNHMKKGGYDYYKARVYGNDVFVSDGLTMTKAIAECQKNSPSQSVFATNYVKAEQLVGRAGNWLGWERYEQHCSKKGCTDGYYWHFHLVAYPDCHIWHL